MQVSEISRRYADALFSLATNNGSAADVFEDIQTLKSAVTTNEDILKYLTAPVFSMTEKQKMIQETFGSILKSEKIKDFLKLLIEKDRISLIKEIIYSFELADDKRNMMTRGTVTTGAELTAAEKGEIEKSVGEKLSLKVVLDFEVDPKLIGGVRVVVGSYLFDGSIKTNLRMLNEEITRSIH
jgi:F-type H+-transporting ATPase subunit delta